MLPMERNLFLLHFLLNEHFYGNTFCILLAVVDDSRHYFDKATRGPDEFQKVAFRHGGML